MYRVNYGNGLVSRDFGNKCDAMHALAVERRRSSRAFIERHEPGTADAPGDWFPMLVNALDAKQFDNREPSDADLDLSGEGRTASEASLERTLRDAGRR